MSIWDQVGALPGATETTTPATPSAPVATSSAADVEGGSIWDKVGAGVPTTETMAATPETSKWSPWGGVKAADRTKMREDMTDKMFDEWFKENPDATTPERWKVRNEKMEIAKALVDKELGELDVPAVESDPQGVGGGVRFAAKHDPGKLLDLGLQGLPGASTAVQAVSDVADQALGAVGLPAFEGDERLARSVVAPIAALSRGIQEDLYVPSERNEDGTPRLHEEGPLSYNESTEAWGVEQVSRLALSTFASTAAAAGYDKWKAEGWDPEDDSWFNPMDWAVPELLSATWAGWGSDEHTRKLERGHDVVTLRNELDLGRLLPWDLFTSAAPLALADMATGGETEVTKTLREAVDYPKDMTAALALSILDIDAFMGLGLGAKTVDLAKTQVGLSAESGAISQGLAKAGIELPENPWGTHAMIGKYGASIKEAWVRVQTMQEGLDMADPQVRFSAAKEVERITRELPRGADVVFTTLVKTLNVIAAKPSTVALKRLRAAQQAEAALLKATEGVDEALAEAEAGVRAAKEARSAMDAPAPSPKAGAKAQKLQDVPPPKTKRAANKDVSVRTKVLRMTEARTAHSAAVELLRNLEAHQESLSLLAQVPGYDKATSKGFDSAKGAMAQAFENLHTAMELRRVGGAGTQEAFQEAAFQYQEVARRSVVDVGRRAEELLADQITDAKAKVAALGGEYKTAQTKALDAAPKDLKKVIKDVVKAHAKATKATAKHAASADAHAVMLSSMEHALALMHNGFRGLKGQVKAAPEEVALAQQSLLTAEAMRYVGAGRVERVALVLTGVAREMFLPHVAASARYGGETDFLQRYGSITTNDLNVGLKDMLKVGMAMGDEAPIGMVDLGDSVENVAGSMYNVFTGVSMFHEARPVLRALLGQTGAQGKAGGTLAAGFYPQGADVDPAHLARLREGLANLLRYGKATVPAKADRAAAEAATKDMSWDSLLLKLYHHSVSVIDDPQLAAWITHKKTLVEGTEEFERVARMGFKEILQEGIDARRLMVAGTELTDLQKAAAGSVGPLERAVVRMHQGLLHATITARVGRSMTEEAGASKEALEAMYKLGEGSHKDIGPGMAEAADVMAKLGMDMTSRTMAAAGEEIRTGVMVLSDPAGEFHGFIPRPFITAMDKKLGAIINTGEAFHSPSKTPMHDAIKQFARATIRAQQTSMLTGLIFPNPRYYTNILVGNFTQMWTTGGIGLGTAVKVTMDSGAYVAQGAGTHIAGLPGISKVLETAREQMATRLGVDIDKVLPTLTSAFMNPYVAAVLDTNLAKNSDLVPDKFGRNLTYGDVRNGMRDGLVFQSFAHQSTLAQLSERTRGMKALTGNTPMDKLKALKGQFADMADALEQRQRIALFSELVFNKGMSMEEAGRKVNEALYDWSAPMTSLEAEWAVSLFMFWNFQRRAMGQALRVLASPITETRDMGLLEAGAASNTALAAMTGTRATSMAHFRDIVKSYHAVKEGARSGDEDSDVYPWWSRKSGQHAMMTNVPMSAARMEFDQARGIKANTLAYTIPNATPLEYINLFGRLGQLTAGYATGNARGAEASEEIARELAGFGGFVTEDMLTGIVDATWGPPHPDFGKEYRVVKSPGDVAQFRALDAFFAASDWTNPKAYMSDTPREGFVKLAPDGGVAVHRSLLKFKSILPFVGIELSRAVDPLLYTGVEMSGAEDKEDYLRSIAMMFGSVTGVGRSLAYDPKDVKKKDIKYAKMAARTKAKEEKKYSGADDRGFFGRKDRAPEPEAPEAAPSSGSIWDKVGR